MSKNYQRRYFASENLTELFDGQPFLSAIYNLMELYEKHSKVNKNLTCKVRYDCNDINIYGDCPESEEEFNERMKRIHDQEEQELAEYERLKAKFESDHGKPTS